MLISDVACGGISRCQLADAAQYLNWRRTRYRAGHPIMMPARAERDDRVYCCAADGGQIADGMAGSSVALGLAGSGLRGRPGGTSAWSL